MKGPKGRWIVKTPSEANGLGIYMANTMEQIWPNLTRSLLSHPEDKEALVVSRSVIKGVHINISFGNGEVGGGVYWGWLIYHSFFALAKLVITIIQLPVKTKFIPLYSFQ